MKHFLVTLQIQCGDYQKHATTLQAAHSEDQAMKSALIGQCHGDIEEGSAIWDDEFTIEDVGGEFFYTVDSCEEVEPLHVHILKKYMTVYSN